MMNFVFKCIRSLGWVACFVAFQSTLFHLLTYYRISKNEYLKNTTSSFFVWNLILLTLDGVLLSWLLVSSRKKCNKYHLYLFLAGEIILIILLCTLKMSRFEIDLI